MMNLGFSTMATPELNAYGAVSAAREYGYDFVCLRVHEFGGELQIDTPAAELSNIRRAFTDSGVEAGAFLDITECMIMPKRFIHKQSIIHCVCQNLQKKSVQRLYVFLRTRIFRRFLPRL